MRAQQVYQDPAAQKIGSEYRKGKEAYIKTGELLIKQKAKLKHGEWLPWLEQNKAALGFDQRTARSLMQWAKDPDLLPQDVWGSGDHLVNRPRAADLESPKPSPSLPTPSSARDTDEEEDDWDEENESEEENERPRQSTSEIDKRLKDTIRAADDLVRLEDLQEKFASIWAELKDCGTKISKELNAAKAERRRVLIQRNYHLKHILTEAKHVIDNLWSLYNDDEEQR